MSICACDPLNNFTCIVHDDNGFADRMERIEEKIDRILEMSEKVERLVSTVADQVKPVLDDLMKSPLLKMLGVKKS